MVHVPAKFRENINAFSSYSAKTKRDGQTDRQTDGRTDRRTDGRGCCNISRPQAYGAAGDNKRIEDIILLYIDSHCPYLLFGETTSHLTSK